MCYVESNVQGKNTTTIHLHHLEWKDDSLAIYFAHMKNDQTGSRKRDARHIYANPMDHEVCPILALGMYLNIYAPSPNEQKTELFPGSSQYARFAKSFDLFLKKHTELFKKEFGVDTKNIGVHSIRKGAATFISSGSTCAPPQVATNIRAG